MHAQRSPIPAARARPALSGWIKASYTMFAGAAVAVFLTHAGGQYWYAEFALVASVVALWYEQRLLASMTALAVLVPELAWTIGFLALLLGGVDPLGLARPLFETQMPLSVRLASASHVVVPTVLAWLVYRLGYDPRALRAQTFLAWIVLVLGVALAPALAGGVSGTLAMAARLREAWLPGWLWVALLMITYPVVVYLPAHLLLQQLFGPAHHRLLGRAGRLFRRGAGPRLASARRRGRGRASAPGLALHARLRDFADFALVRRRRR